MKKGAVWLVFSHALRYPFQMAGAILCALGSVAASLIGPRLIGEAVDAMASQGAVDFALVGRIVMELAFVYGIYSLALWCLSYLSNRIAYLTVKAMRSDLFDKMGALPLSFFDSVAYGDTMGRFVADMDAIADALLQGVSVLFTGVATIVGAVFFMLGIDPLITLIVLASTPLSILVSRFIVMRSQKMFREQARAQGVLGGYAEEMFSGQRVVQAFGREEAAAADFQKLNDELYSVGLKAQLYSASINPTTRLVNNIAYAAVGAVACLAAIDGRVTVGGVSSFLIYAGVFAKPFNEITGVFTQIQAAFASSQRIGQMMSLQPEAPDIPGSVPLKSVRGRIEFKHVFFSYTPGQTLISDFDLSVEPGSRIAIVGRTGAGKTTIVNLLMRFYELESGSILLDGADIAHLPREELRKCFGMVLQDAWLFEGTVAENIAYGRPGAVREEIVKAAKAADAHGFVSRLPQGYDTLVSDAGENFSQGQRQLLTIARVMLADPPVLILDEATSSIDTRTERRVQRAFEAMMRGRTSFVIAHRLSTVREADLIVVMEKGNIIESGAHEELLERGGAYASLYNSQFAQS
ncbi:MAG: ABC transporter ATP-binding protein [Bacillota bacterium]